MKVRSEREVAQSCPTLHDPMDRSLPGSVHGIFQARVLEWGAIAFSALDSIGLQKPMLMPSRNNSEHTQHSPGTRHFLGVLQMLSHLMPTALRGGTIIILF